MGRWALSWSPGRYLQGGIAMRTFLVDTTKIDVIAHGIPDTPFVDPNPYKEQFGVEGRLVALTFGLLSPNKGIESVIRASPAAGRGAVAGRRARGLWWR